METAATNTNRPPARVPGSALAERTMALVDSLNARPNCGLQKLVKRLLADIVDVDGFDAEDRLIAALHAAGLRLLLQRLAADDCIIADPVADLATKLGAIDREAEAARKAAMIRRKAAGNRETGYISNV